MNKEQFINAVGNTVQPFIKRFIEGLIAVGTFVLSWKMYLWAADYIEKADPVNGVAIAAMIAAVLGPLSTLQGYVLAKYITAAANGSKSPE